jgi:vesicle coat complex subunit
MFNNLIVLTMLRYFIHDDIGQDIMPLLRKLHKHKVSMIRRKVTLVLYNIYQILPHLV